MNRPTRIMSLLMAVATTMAIPALAQSACACTTGSTSVGIDQVPAVVAQVLQRSAGFPDPYPGDEVIKAGFPTSVTYSIAWLDRNGESDFQAPVLDTPNVQQLLMVSILRPDGSFVSSSDGIVVPTANGCSLQPVTRTSSVNMASPTAASSDVGTSWLLMSWVDAVPNNGIVSCDFLVNYNNGASTPTGVYTIRPSVIDGTVSAPTTNQGTVNVDPIGFGSSQDVTTTVYDLVAMTTQVGGTGGTIDFGSVRPGDIALNMGGIKLAPGNDVVVTNQAGSQPVDFLVTMQATDLYQNVTDPTGMQRTFAPISCDRIAIAMMRSPTPGDAMTKSNAASPYCDTKTYGGIPILQPGQSVAFNAGILDPGLRGDNYAFAAGQYLGTLKVCLTGPEGQQDPISVGKAPTNPIPSYNSDLTQSVDAVGPAQTAR